MPLILTLLPFIVQLMGLAEKFFADQKQGGDKKAFVMGSLKTLASSVTTVSTGGQKETWKALEPAISKIVDATVPLVFPKAKDTNSARDFTRPLEGY